jgi:hypothetical protein
MTLILTPELVAAYLQSREDEPKPRRSSEARERRLATMRECQRRLKARRAMEAGREPGRNGRPVTRMDRRGVYLREWARRMLEKRQKYGAR